MPELPEVETIKNELQHVLLKRRVVGCRVLRGSVVKGVVSEFEQRMQGKYFTEILRRGKYLLFQMDYSFYLVVHLRMTGKFVFQDADTLTHRHDRVVFKLDKGLCSFNDMRCFGTMEIVNRLSEHQGLKNLGEEPLSSRFTVRYLSECLRRKKSSVKNVSLNQTLIAGLGNIYAAESLFRAGIHPARPAGALSYGEIRKWHRAIRAVLRQALLYNGTTISDYRRVDEKTGEFQKFLNVYGKKGEKCAKCGHSIDVIKQQQRSTYFCPGCQK